MSSICTSISSGIFRPDSVTSRSRTRKAGQNLRHKPRFLETSRFNCSRQRPNNVVCGSGVSLKEVTFSEVKYDTVRLLHARKNPTGLYMLSNLDQTYPLPIEVLLKFQTNSDLVNVDVGGVLKESLSKVLEVYYPFAGIIKVGVDGKIAVDCDVGGSEGGVPFAEAFSDEDMAVAVGDITMIDQKIAKKLVCSNHTPYQTILDVPPLAIQVTRFKCGGMILGVRLNHMICDGIAILDFIKSWSEIARGFPLSINPHLDRSILSPRKPPKVDFPHPEFSKSGKPLNLLAPNENLITKSFIFTPSMLSQLRKLVMQNNNRNEAVSRARTTFELTTALAWVCWTKAKEVGTDETSQITAAVDGRHKLQPPIPKGYFGNCIVLSCAQSRARELMSQPLSYAVGIVHDSLKAVKEDYIRSTIDFYEMTRKPIEVDNTVWITNWTGLPFYEIDFGWGTVSQVAPSSIAENLIVFHSHRKDNKNLLLSLTLPVEAMKIFQELITSQLYDN